VFIYIHLPERKDDGCSETRKRVIRKKAAKFEVKDGELYYKQKGKVILVDLCAVSVSQFQLFCNVSSMLIHVNKYNIVSGHMYLPSSIFLQTGNLPYQFIFTGTLNFIRPFALTNYMYHSFVPSVVSSWNNLPDSVKLCSCISCFKRSLLYHFEALGSY